MPNTDNYDLYNSQGVPTALPGTPDIDESGHLIIPSEPYFSPSTLENSTMDKDPKNTGPTTNFWEYYPLTIDINGYIFYYDENTGINVRGPEGAPRYVSFDSLTEEEIETLKGRDGVDGTNGRNGIDGRDGADGLDAYHLWLQENGYTEEEHPIDEFYDFLSGYLDTLVRQGEGTGSLIVNYEGLQNEANGAGSFASGYNTTANGNYSFTAGLGSVAESDYQFVIGKYNSNDSNNIFEIGYGTGDNARSTVFNITKGGRVETKGDIEDGFGNILSDKVDKENGKGLSTNDFNNNYKNFLDNYTVETSVLRNSDNPVTSSAIYSAIETAKESIANKPSVEIGEGNVDFPILSYKPVDKDKYLEKSVKLSQFIWNPGLKTLKAGLGITNNNYEYNVLLGQGLTSASNNQIIFGKYNEPDADDLLQVGYGSSIENANNAFIIKKNGDIEAAGEVKDGSGNVLSNKQDILLFDTVPTSGSNKVMDSNAIYNAFVSVGITPYVGINIPRLDTLQTEIDENTAHINSINTTLTNLISNLYILTDDITEDRYTIGITNGQLYIKKIETETEEEVVEENGNNEE
ncbi:MAG TPA: hypothetical protein DCL29_02160 [Eubacterium sp.]|nr:hypothetical protein [Eubacterium sp.]